ncbi:MAG: RuBisCO large subunit C-terminal-like domain-containing protein [Nanoarchaeota archaeon]|nr:RuBisCO large subunit C-terminal-like domain-containing protein [Nanoarchaeota archaeon]
MVSGTLSKKYPSYFEWDEGLVKEDYVVATYYIESSTDLKSAAIGIAREQSAADWEFMGDREREYGSDYAARLMDIQALGTTNVPKLDSFALNTPVYEHESKGEQVFNKGIIKIAYPQRNFDTSFTNMMNALAGESHRLGYLNAIKLIDADFNPGFLKAYSGPKYGVEGIREKLGIGPRPVFCRSTRPAVGLKTEDIVRMAEECLTGGYDIFKDDELTCDTSRSPFTERIKSMVQAIDKVETKTGEKKLYIANVIDDEDHMHELIDAAAENGVDGIIFAPIMNGCGLMKSVAAKKDLLMLSHNSYIDVETRHPEFGIGYPLWLKMQRMCGGDFIMGPVTYGTPFMDQKGHQEVIDACLGDFNGFKKALPIMAGGREAHDLPFYLKVNGGSPDFMLIVASALDHHPQGMTAGSRAFRQAWDSIEKKIPMEEYAKDHSELADVLKK